VSSSIRPWFQRQECERSAAFRTPQLLLLLHSLVQHQALQLILDPRVYLHQLVPMSQQLAIIAHVCTGHLDAWKSIGLLFPHIAGTNLRIQHGDLLETGVKITIYDDHAVSFLPLTLVSKINQSLPGSAGAFALINQLSMEIVSPA
jgi:hypothetical protein